MTPRSGKLIALALATGGGGACCLAVSLALLRGGPGGQPAVLPLFLVACLALAVAAAAAGLALARRLLGRPLNRRAAERLDLRTDLPPDGVRRARGALDRLVAADREAEAVSARIVATIGESAGTAAAPAPPPRFRRFR